MGAPGGLQGRKVGGQLRVAQLVHMLRVYEPAKRMHTQVEKRHIIRQLIAGDLHDRFGHDDLSTVRESP